LDSLDIRILRELWQGREGFPLEPDVRKSYRSMARRLKIDNVTFRNRLSRFYRSGYWKGTQLGVNPSLLGIKANLFWLLDVQLPLEKDVLIRELSLVQGVMVIIDYYGPSLAVGTLLDGKISIEKQSELFAKLSGAREVIWVDLPFPKCKLELTPTHWRIVKAIRANPRQSYPVISKEVGVSVKTVKRRLQKMNEAGALFVMPLQNLKALEGAIVADLVVLYSNAEAKTDVDNRIISQFEEFLTLATMGDPKYGFFTFVIGKIWQAKEMLSWVKRQPGVVRAFMGLVQDRIESYETFTRLLEKKLREESIYA